MPEAPTAEAPTLTPEAVAVATAPPIHADDAGDRPMGEFGSPDPNAEADTPPKFTPPKREPAKPAAKEPPVEPAKAPKAEKPAAEPEKAAVEEFNPEKAAPKALREAYAKIKSRAAALEKELADHKAKPAAPVDDPEKKVFQEKLTAAEKRHAELLEDLKYVDFEKHPDFAKDYQEPFEHAYQAGRSHVRRMSVTLPDGTTRKGTDEDFDAIAGKAVQDYDAAAQMAEEMFGPVKAATVLTKLGEASALFDRKEKARAEWRTKGNEREKARTVERENFHKQVSEEIKSLWSEHVDGAAKKYPQWSAPVEGDDEGNSLLESGYKLVNDGFETLAAPALADPKMSKQERARIVEMHARIRNGAAWFPRVENQNKQLRGEVAALKAKLAEFESSTPKGGEGGRGTVAEEGEGEQSIAAFVRGGK